MSGWRREAAAGYLAGACTDAVFFALDAYKTQLQAGRPVEPRRMLRGVVSLSLAGSGPSLGFFFGGYYLLKQSAVGGSAGGVLTASLLCAVPSSMLAVPADTVKKRVVLGLDRSPLGAVRSVLAGPGWAGLMVGWRANLAKDVPFAGLKMSLYEGLMRCWAAGRGCHTDQLAPWEKAGVGLGSGVLTAVLTNPLDVVNTRIKGGLLPGGVVGCWPAGLHVAKVDGLGALWAGVGPRIVIIGLGSSTFFWILEHAKLAYDNVAGLP